MDDQNDLETGENIPLTELLELDCHPVRNRDLSGLVLVGGSCNCIRVLVIKTPYFFFLPTLTPVSVSGGRTGYGD
jgi:hypothetical protein